jgi:hypothetical protein
VPSENIVGLAAPSDNYYKLAVVSKMKICQPGSQNLAWGRPHVQSRKVCPSKLLFNILFTSFE